MSRITVTSEDLQALSGQVASGSSNIQQQLGQMASQVTGVVGGDWQGVASSQFNTLWDEWQRSAAGLKDALDGISRLLSSAATQYENTEYAIRASMG